MTIVRLAYHIGHAGPHQKVASWPTTLGMLAPTKNMASRPPHSGRLHSCCPQASLEHQTKIIRGARARRIAQRATPEFTPKAVAWQTKYIPATNKRQQAELMGAGLKVFGGGRPTPFWRRPAYQKCVGRPIKMQRPAYRKVVGRPREMW